MGGGGFPAGSPARELGAPAFACSCYHEGQQQAASFPNKPVPEAPGFNPPLGPSLHHFSSLSLTITERPQRPSARHCRRSRFEAPARPERKSVEACSISGLVSVYECEEGDHQMITNDVQKLIVAPGTVGRCRRRANASPWVAGEAFASRQRPRPGATINLCTSLVIIW